MSGLCWKLEELRQLQQKRDSVGHPRPMMAFVVMVEEKATGRRGAVGGDRVSRPGINA